MPSTAREPTGNELAARTGLSHSQVGEMLALSGERVRQIEERALGKLRAAADYGERE